MTPLTRCVLMNLWVRCVKQPLYRSVYRLLDR